MKLLRWFIRRTLLIIYMNKDILKKELDKLGVNPNEYSLNGEH